MKELPLLTASWDEEKCMVCNNEHDLSDCVLACNIFSDDFIENYPDIEQALTDIEVIGDIDCARRWMKSLHLLSKEPTSETVQRILQLSSTNRAACDACVATVQADELLSLIMPENVTAEQAGLLLSILNTNR